MAHGSGCGWSGVPRGGAGSSACYGTRLALCSPAATLAPWMRRAPHAPPSGTPAHRVIARCYPDPPCRRGRAFRPPRKRGNKQTKSMRDCEVIAKKEHGGLRGCLQSRPIDDGWHGGREMANCVQRTQANIWRSMCLVPSWLSGSQPHSVGRAQYSCREVVSEQRGPDGPPVTGPAFR